MGIGRTLDIWLYLFTLHTPMRKAVLFICLMLTLAAIAQQSQQPSGLYTKAQLEAKRKEIQDAINETEHELEEIKKNKNATMSQLRALQYKLAQRQTLINNINEEIDSIDEDIKSSSKEIGSLRQKLEMEKMHYAQSLRYSYESRSSYDILAFLFSSADFNDAMRRMKYLRQFREFRRQQVEQIRQTQDQIGHKIQDLNKQKSEKDNLLVSQKNQSQALMSDVQETNQAMQELKGKEAQLQREAEKNRKTAARINHEIQLIINREIEAAQKRAEQEEKKRLAAANANKPNTTAPPKPGGTKATEPARSGATKPVAPKAEEPTLLMTPTDVALASNFEGNKGKMYWPVSQGFISDHFGVHPSPFSKYVEISNDGIDIRTSAHASVRAVFEGTVSSVFTVEGSTVVMIQHGNYFTVYNNLSTSNVSKGQHVSTLQSIGTVAENDEGEPTIKFQIWKSAGKKGTSQKLNPELWLGKAH